MNSRHSGRREKKELVRRAGPGLWPACLVACVFFSQLLPACQRPVARAAGPLAAAADTTLYGMFAYMADAAVFVRCSDGKRFPVLMEGKFEALERSYLQLTGEEAGRRVLLACHGRLVRRAAEPAEEVMAEGLRVDTVFSLNATLSCADEPVSWAGKYRWRQGESLFLPCGEEEEVRVAAGGPEATLRAAWSERGLLPDRPVYVELEGVRGSDGQLYPTRIRKIVFDFDCQ
jgi:hypothetical protein